MLIYNPKSSTVDIDGRRIELPTRPAQVMRALWDAGGDIVSKEMLCEAMYGERWREEGIKVTAVEKHVSRLRNHLKPDGGLYIRTVRDKGYRFRQLIDSDEETETPPPAHTLIDPDQITMDDLTDAEREFFRHWRYYRMLDGNDPRRASEMMYIFDLLLRALREG